MIPAIGYYLRLLVYRQAMLAPVLVYLGVVAMIYASPAGPPLPAAAVTSVALMPVTAWLARLTATSESPPFAEITLVMLGGPLRRQAARSAATMAVALFLGCAATLWGAVTNPEPYLAQTVITMAGMHAAQACAGAGIGVLLGPPLRTRAGTAVAGVTGLTVASLVVPWLPPLNPLLQAVFLRKDAGPVLLLTVSGQAVAVGAVCAVVGCAIARYGTVAPRWARRAR